jgi:trehalose transport system permease protein
MTRRPWLGLLPLAGYLAALTLLPLGSTLWLSAADPAGGLTAAHFRQIASHYQFAEAVGNTLAVTGLSLAIEIVLGLLLALALAARPRGRAIFQLLLILPLGVPTIVVAAVMRSIVGVTGYGNEVLLRLGAIQAPIDWVGERGLAILTVAAADAWKVTPFVLLIVLAGLERIPAELYEAARTDGASPWRQLRSVTLPLLKPSLSLALIVRGVDAFRIFALPLALAGRGLPVLSTYAYVEFLEYGNPHTAAASSVLLLGIILAAAAGYLALAGREEVLR